MPRCDHGRVTSRSFGTDQPTDRLTDRPGHREVLSISMLPIYVSKCEYILLTLKEFSQTLFCKKKLIDYS